MNIIYFLLPVALVLGGGFAIAFSYFSWRGQFDDLETPAHRILIDDDDVSPLRKKGNST